MTKRWKSQSLQLHRHLTGPESPARALGLLPRFALLAAEIARCGGVVAGLAKKRWRDDCPEKMSIATVRAIRSEIDALFDQLEAELQKPASADGVLDERTAQQNYDRHGNLGLLVLGLMEEAAELSGPLLEIATGAATLDAVRPQVDDESADLRVYLHIACEQTETSSELSTSAKWARVRAASPDAAFQIHENAEALYHPEYGRLRGQPRKAIAQ